MEKIKIILNDKRFIDAVRKLHVLEKERVFCGHDMHHFLDVSRIAWIYVLEHHLDYEKDVVYATGLLHDIGRVCQYEEGIPHQIAGARIAEAILIDAGFDQRQTAVITDAIRNHRKVSDSDSNSLNAILYMADKKSRACYDCKAKGLCHWPDSLKNSTIMD